MSPTTIKSKLLLAVTSLLLLTGCAPKTRVLPYYGNHHGDLVEVLTPGVTIRATDGSFTLSSGEATAAPQQLEVYGCPVARETPTGVEAIDAYDWPSAKALGFVEVMVEHPDSERPLHGLMALCPVHRDERVISRRYEVQVPRSSIPRSETAVEVVYEYSEEHRKHGRPLPGFMLFLSQEPLEGGRSQISRGHIGVGTATSFGGPSDDPRPSVQLGYAMALPPNQFVSTFEASVGWQAEYYCAAINAGATSNTFPFGSIFIGLSTTVNCDTYWLNNGRSFDVGLAYFLFDGPVRATAGVSSLAWSHRFVGDCEYTDGGRETYWCEEDYYKTETDMAPFLSLTWFQGQ